MRRAKFEICSFGSFHLSLSPFVGKNPSFFSLGSDFFLNNFLALWIGTSGGGVGYEGVSLVFLPNFNDDSLLAASWTGIFYFF